MTQYLEDRPDQVVDCVHRMADLHGEIHQREVSDIPDLRDLREVLVWSIDNAELLSQPTRDAVLKVLDRLPGAPPSATATSIPTT